MLTELALPYADTDAAALQWSSQRPSAGPLDVLSLGSGASRLELHLLGASHCAVLHSRAEHLVETVACPAYGAVGMPLPEQRERVQGPLHYRFASQVERLDAVALGDLAARLRDGVRGRRDRLAGVFPGSADALTVLAGALGRSGARWRTWHLYPNTGEAVRTTTAVTW